MEGSRRDGQSSGGSAEALAESGKCVRAARGTSRDRDSRSYGPAGLGSAASIRAAPIACSVALRLHGIAYGFEAHVLRGATLERSVHSSFAFPHIRAKISLGMSSHARGR